MFEQSIFDADDWVYCPYCQRIIVAANTMEVEAGEHDGYVFIHDDIEHPDEYPDGYRVEVLH